MPTEKSTLRKPWGYANINNTRRSVSPGTSSAPRRRSIPRRGHSPGITKRVKELGDTTAKTCYNSREVNAEQNVLEARVMELEAALAAEQVGAQKLFETIAKLRSNQNALKELTVASEGTALGRESVKNTRNHFGAPTPTIASPTTITPPFEVPVKSVADPVPGASRALFVCTDSSKNDALYSLQASLIRNGFRSQRRVIVSAPDSHEHPTRQTIINGIQWLIDDAQPGDSLLFAFIGQGVSVTGIQDRVGGIAPTDWASADIISELDLYTLLIKGLATGVRLTAIFDLEKGLPGLSPSMFQSSLYCRGKTIMSDTISGTASKIINADVTVMSYAFCPAQPEVGVLSTSVSEMFESLGLEMLLADFMLGVTRISDYPFQVSSTSEHYDQKNWLYLGILPTKKIASAAESENPFLVQSSVPVITSRPTVQSEPVQTVVSSSSIARTTPAPTHHIDAANVVKAMLLLTPGDANATSMQTALHKFFSRHGLHSEIRTNDVTWFLSDIQPGDAVFIFESQCELDDGCRENILKSIPKGSRLTWLQESCHDNIELWGASFRNQRFYSSAFTLEDGMTVGARHGDAPFAGGVVNIITGPVDCTFAAFIGSMNRHMLHPTAGQLLASMASISSDSIDADDGDYSFSIGLISTRKLTSGTPMQVSGLPQAGFGSSEGTSAPPTPALGSRPSPNFVVPINYNVSEVVRKPSPPAADHDEVTAPIVQSDPPPEVLKIINSLPVEEPPPPPSEAVPPPAPAPAQIIEPPPPNIATTVPGRSYEDYVNLVTILLKQFDPGRLNQVDQILDEYRGNEELMLEALAIQVGAPNYFTVRRSLLKYYDRVNPHKKDQVDSILVDYLNAWDELYQDLEERYGKPVLEPEPEPEHAVVSPQRNREQPPIQGDSTVEIGTRDLVNSTPNPRMALFSEGTSSLVMPVSTAHPPITAINGSPQLMPQFTAPVSQPPPQVPHHSLPIPSSEATPFPPSTSDTELLQKRSDAEQRYLQLKEQTDSFRKRVEALKERGSSPTNPLGISDIALPEVSSLLPPRSVSQSDKQLENTWLHWVEPAVTSSRLM